MPIALSVTQSDLKSNAPLQRLKSIDKCYEHPSKITEFIIIYIFYIYIYICIHREKW